MLYYALHYFTYRDPFLSKPNSSTLSQVTWKTYSRLNYKAIPPSTLSWLLDATSLTQRLIAACQGKFQVEVLYEGWGRPTQDEIRVLSMKPGTIARIRQVRLLCNGVAVVFARTIIPYSTLKGPVRRLRLLGNRPLGAVLFADTSMRRGALEIAAIGKHSSLYRDAMGAQRNKPAIIWGRRSVFYLSGKPLLVNEIFLPGLPSKKPA